jgi:hypothetical protein
VLDEKSEGEAPFGGEKAIGGLGYVPTADDDAGADAGLGLGRESEEEDTHVRADSVWRMEDLVSGDGESVPDQSTSPCRL